MIYDIAKRQGGINELYRGFIKLNRSLLEWRWYRDANTMRVFVHLLLSANIVDHDFEKITVHRGEIVVSYVSLAQALGMSVQSVRTAIAHLESTGELTRKKYSKFQVISIQNYDSYQRSSTGRVTVDQQPDNRRSTPYRQQLKKDKNERMKEYAERLTAGECSESIVPEEFGSAEEYHAWLRE